MAPQPFPTFFQPFKKVESPLGAATFSNLLQPFPTFQPFNLFNLFNLSTFSTFPTFQPFYSKSSLNNIHAPAAITMHKRSWAKRRVQKSMHHLAPSWWRAMSAPPPAGPLRPLSHTEPTAAAPSRATPTILTRFSCCRCGFESHVDYHGRTPPFNRSIVFLENVFLIRSPMGDANRPLCLGGTCVVWCAAKTLRSLTTTQGTAAHTNEPRLRAAPLARGHTRVRAHGNWC